LHLRARPILWYSLTHNSFPTVAKSKSANTLGIENVKRVAAFLLLVSNMIVDLVRNFSYGKALTLAFTIGENLDILDVGRLALAEIRDMTVEESQQVSDYLGQEFDIENDQLERRIEEGLDLIPQGYALIKENIAFYEKLRGFVTSWRRPDPAKVPELESALRRVNLPGIRKDIALAV
jgi:hypothetical protein